MVPRAAMPNVSLSSRNDFNVAQEDPSSPSRSSPRFTASPEIGAPALPARQWNSTTPNGHFASVHDKSNHSSTGLHHVGLNSLNLKVNKSAIKPNGMSRLLSSSVQPPKLIRGSFSVDSEKKAFASQHSVAPRMGIDVLGRKKYTEQVALYPGMPAPLQVSAAVTVLPGFSGSATKHKTTGAPLYAVKTVTGPATGIVKKKKNHKAPKERFSILTGKRVSSGSSPAKGKKTKLGKAGVSSSGKPSSPPKAKKNGGWKNGSFMVSPKKSNKKKNTDKVEIPSARKQSASATGEAVKPRKKRPKKAVVEVEVEPVAAVPSLPVVIPFLSVIPESAPFTDLVHACRGSGLSAIVNPKNEKKAIKQLRDLKKIYEDSQLASQILPTATPFELVDAPSSVIGDLLSFCRFVDVAQSRDKAARNKQCLFDFDFVLNAVTADGGKSGHFTALLHLLVNQLREFLPPGHERKEFCVSIDELKMDHIIACEVFRHYMNIYAVTTPQLFPAEFRLVLDKLKTDNIMDLSTIERISLLVKSHDVLVQGTWFIKQCDNTLTEERKVATAQFVKLDEERKAETEKKAELDKQLVDFDGEAGLEGVASRQRTAERTRKTDAIRKVETKISELGNQMQSVEAELKVISKALSKLYHLEPLGYDRFHNRYWYFPDISDKIFVESGWACIPVHHQLAAPVSDANPVVNFAFVDDTAEHFRIDEHLLYLLSDGMYKLCDETPGFPTASDHKWSYYTEAMVPALTTALNLLGIREKQLMAQIARRILPVQILHALPEVVDNALEAVQKYVSQVVDKLIANQFLSESLPDDWQTIVESGEIAELKSLILAVFNSILKPLLKDEILSTSPRWDMTLIATNNLSRIYFLFVILDVSVKWDRRLSQIRCRECGYGDRAKLRRCLSCLDVCHDGRCAAFLDGICNLCREPTYDLKIMDMLDTVPSRRRQTSPGTKIPDSSGEEEEAEKSNSSGGSARENNRPNKSDGEYSGHPDEVADDDEGPASRLRVRKSFSREISLDSAAERRLCSTCEDSEGSRSPSCYPRSREISMDSFTERRLRQRKPSEDSSDNYAIVSRLRQRRSPEKCVEKSYSFRDRKAVNYASDDDSDE